MALVVARQVPTSSTMAVPHGPAGVRAARQRMRIDLRRTGVSDSVIDDAVLILSELLSNAWRHGRPWRSDHGGGTVRAAWTVDEDDRLTVEVTDGGGPTRPLPAKPSVTARGGRGLNIIRSLAEEWGVRDDIGEVTVWALLPPDDEFARRLTIPSDLSPELNPRLGGAELASGLRPDLDAHLEAGLDANLGSNLGSNLDADLGPGLGSNIEANIDPDFDRELDFADLDELA
ncbi:ATP-binding protein [Streptomyces iranensis]|uniref:Anti-sigma regulatory factor (Ser/Thr protein kinase) n=1 Tax=Streptomyces iranensis TaxID=576784 RepID=A0ABS4N3S1_9ACTN|nr:anti-sigma regulatory factor (Ser/Thr protein kinase) [Streptomyces iranensis]